MSTFLYRYIGFDTFVGMVQNKSLTFVLPELWDDPQEDSAFIQLVKSRKKDVQRAFLLASHKKFFAQSWSELAESDAMWRIYSYSNRAVRIKIDKEKISQLENVRAVPVKYSDEPFDLDGFDEEVLLASLAYKRTAFCHEKEIRLISSHRYPDIKDAEAHIKALCIICEHPDRVKMIESMFPGLELEEKIDRIVEMLNIGDKCKKTKEVSYAHIPNFIEGVMVHPLAPDWYVEVVREFCKRNDVPFEGKSELYSDNSEY